MSEACRSISGSPSTIHSASARPTPGPSLTHTAAADQRPRTSGVSPRIGRPSGVSESRPLIAYLMPTDSSPTISGISSSACSICCDEVVLGERQLGRRQRRLLDRGDLVGVVQDRAVGVRADLEPAAVLALVHVRVHVAHDRELDRALGAGEVRHRADVDHLVDGRRERDRRAGHARQARAPDAAGDHHDVGLDVAARRCARASRGRARRRCRAPRCWPTPSARRRWRPPRASACRRAASRPRRRSGSRSRRRSRSRR